jgi:hypothetical protein
MNKYQKMLKILGHEVAITGQKHAQPIRDLLKGGVLKFVESKEFPSYSWSEPTPFEDRESTCTFEDCIDVTVRIDETVTVKVFSGDSYDGYRLDLRASYTFSGDWWNCEALCNAVMHAFNRHTLHLLQLEEAAEREKKRQTIANRILSEMKQ